MRKKKFWLNILVMMPVYGITVILLLTSCASFGVYGSIDHVNDRIFIVNISVPPIAGGGSPTSNFRAAMRYAAKEVKKQGCNNFVIVQGGYNEQLVDISFNMDMGHKYDPRGNAVNTDTAPQYATASTSNYIVVYALLDEEKEFMEWANKEGYLTFSAKHILQ